MGRRPFAASMKKREGGFFLRIDFQLDPGKLAGLQGRLKLNEDIFRLQVVGVEKERRLAANDLTQARDLAYELAANI